MSALSSPLPPEAEALLAEMPDWGSEFDRTFANHAPMVLTALARIGGSPQQMRRFFDHYRSYKPCRRRRWVMMTGNPPSGTVTVSRIFASSSVGRWRNTVLTGPCGNSCPFLRRASRRVPSTP